MYHNYQIKEHKDYFFLQIHLYLILYLNLDLMNFFQLLLRKLFLYKLLTSAVDKEGFIFDSVIILIDLKLGLKDILKGEYEE